MSEAIAIAKAQALSKSNGVAYLLWFFLGMFGAHRFYMDQKHGVTMLVLTIVGILTGILVIGYLILLGVWVWWIVDAFSIHKWVAAYNLNIITELEKSHAQS